MLVNFWKVLKLSSRSATVIVILVIAIVAFCLATVFASMTGPISILPNASNNSSVLDNLSAITDSDDNYQTYGSPDTSKDYSRSYDYSQSSSDDSQVETTTDDSSSHNDKSSSSSNVETTTDDSSSSSSSSSSRSSSSSSNVETTRG